MLACTVRMHSSDVQFGYMPFSSCCSLVCAAGAPANTVFLQPSTRSVKEPDVLLQEFMRKVLRNYSVFFLFLWPFKLKDFTTFREIFIELILSTDMSKHLNDVTKLKGRLEANGKPLLCLNVRHISAALLMGCDLLPHRANLKKWGRNFMQI